MREQDSCHSLTRKGDSANPALFEALESTKLNLLLKTGYNEKVAENSALYLTKQDENLVALIDECEEVNKNL